MQRLFILLILFVSPLFAEDLPILWLEAGKENECGDVVHEPLPQDWTLRFEHRILDQGKIHEDRHVQAQEHRTLKIKPPPLKPGVMLKAKLFIGDKPYREVVIASPDPFEDRKEWFDKHPIALYDPEKTTIKIFEEEKIPFDRILCIPDLEDVFAIIVIGQHIDFDKEKGLAKLLFQKAAEGCPVLVAAPMGDIPLDYHPAIYSLTLSAEAKYLFPLATGRRCGNQWALQARGDQLFLVQNSAVPYGYGSEAFKVGTAGPSILDIRFAAAQESQSTQPVGRIVFDSNLRFFENIESRWYFKSLIETLTKK